MKASKKIIGASCALVAAVALSAGSTFAWFTSNNSVTVGNIEAEVVTGGGDLKIALVEKSGTDGKWTPGIYSYSLTAPTFSGKLNEVTTSDGYKFTNKTSVDSSGVVTSTDAAADGTYLQFTVSLLSSTDMDIYIDFGTTLTSELKDGASAPASSVVKAWDESITEANYGAAVAVGSNIEAKAENAARIAFVPWADSTKGLDATDFAVSTTNATKYYAPYDSADGTTGAGFYKGNLAQDYLTLSNTGSVATKADNYYIPTGGTAVVAPTAALTNETAGAATTAKLLSLTANTPQFVTISLWIEGKDGDCLNSIFAQTITSTIKLFGLEKTTGTGD